MGMAIQTLVVLAAIGCAACAIYFSSRNENRRDRLALCFFGLMVLLVGSSLYFEFCGEGLSTNSPASVVRVLRDGSWTSSRLGMFEFGDGQTFNVPDEFAAQRSVTPITDNPKARRITYGVSIEMTNPGKFFLYESGRWGKRDKYEIAKEVGDAVDFWLYEFNDKHSKELAKFYNPLDRAQVKEFEELLLPWLNDKINREGLRAKSLSFTVD